MKEIFLIREVTKLPYPISEIISNYLHFIAIKAGLDIYIFDGEKVNPTHTVDSKYYNNKLLITDSEFSMADIGILGAIDLEKGIIKIPDLETNKRRKVETTFGFPLDSYLESSFLCFNQRLYGINRKQIKLWHITDEKWIIISEKFYLDKYSKINFWKNYIVKVSSFEPMPDKEPSVVVSLFDTDNGEITTFSILDIFIYYFSILVYEDTLYIFGGKTYGNNTDLYGKNVYCFDLVNTTLEKCSDIPGISNSYCPAKLGKYIYLINKNYTSIDNTYKYDVISDTWTNIPNLVPKNSIFSVMSY